MTFGYLPQPFGALWPTAKGLLDKAVHKGGNDWAEVEAQLGDGRAQLWLTMDGGPINATVSRMDGDTVEIWLCGGAVLSGALGYLETIIEAAREHGAKSARIVGRKGWQRVLKPYGWRPAGDELAKDLAL